MPAVRLAMAQINPTVGDLKGNLDLILRFCHEAASANCTLVVFPELALSGYPIEDLALSEDFLESCEQSLNQLAKSLVESGLGKLKVVIGHPKKANSADNWAKATNSASVLHEGSIVATYSKHHLPNYSVFDEYRIFVPGSSPLVIEHEGSSFAIVICEDIWQDQGPLDQINHATTDMVLVLNGSPFEQSKTDIRLELLKNLSLKYRQAFCYLNLVGAQDDLVFDGNSFLLDAEGNEIVRLRQFEEELGVIDFESKTNIRPITPTSSVQGQLEQVWGALVLGLRDYVKKNGFNSVILGLSGGIDSAVCATIAADALGPENVFGVSMPSKYSSDHSITDAFALANKTGINYSQIPIQDFVENFDNQIPLEGIASENLQARLRGLILMSLSNRDGHLVLSTGNKSEIAVGYSTIYGDSVGGFAPIKDVEKSLVWELARHRNKLAETGKEPIPTSSIAKEPSAELRPGQKDQDSLPTYEILDQILRGLIEERKSTTEISKPGIEKGLVKKINEMVKRAEWKRRQGPIGPRITKLAFGRERRFPITNKFD